MRSGRTRLEGVTHAPPPTRIAEELSRSLSAFRRDPDGRNRRERRALTRAMDRAIEAAEGFGADPSTQTLFAALWSVRRAVEGYREKTLVDVERATVWLVVGWALARARAAFEAAFPHVPLVAREPSGLLYGMDQALRRWGLSGSLDARLRELEALQDHDRQVHEARAKVTILESLNVFTDSPSEQTVDELTARTSSIQDGTKHGLAQLRSDVWAGLHGDVAAATLARLTRVRFCLERLVPWGRPDPRSPFYDADVQNAFMRPLGIVLGFAEFGVELDELERVMTEVSGLFGIRTRFELALRCARILSSGASVEPFPPDALGRRLHVDHTVASVVQAIGEMGARDDFIRASQAVSSSASAVSLQAFVVQRRSAEISFVESLLPFEGESERRAREANAVLHSLALHASSARETIDRILDRAIARYPRGVAHLKMIDLRARAVELHSVPVRINEHIRRRPRWTFRLGGAAEFETALNGLEQSLHDLFGSPLELLRGFVIGAV
jgi:hypothetical protein